jgi:hypothetical protein
MNNVSPFLWNKRRISIFHWALWVKQELIDLYSKIFDEENSRKITYLYLVTFSLMNLLDYIFAVQET